MTAAGNHRVVAGRSRWTSRNRRRPRCGRAAATTATMAAVTAAVTATMAAAMAAMAAMAATTATTAAMAAAMMAGMTDHGLAADTAVRPLPPARWQPGRGSLRGRILVPFIIILTAATLVSVVVQREVLLSQLNTRIDADLRQEVTELERLVGGRDAAGECVSGTDPSGGCVVGRDPETGEPFGADIRAVFDTFLRRNIPSDFETMLTFVGGDPYKVPAVRHPYASEADEHLYGLGDIRSPQRGLAETAHGTIRYLAVPVRTPDGEARGVFAVAQFVDLQSAEVEDALRLITATQLLFLLVASVLAYVLAGRLLDPVRRVTETARQISETDLSRRITVVGDDEVAQLGRTFNQMLDRLQTAFVAQRNFVDDAGHELRTPITIIRGHLELLGNHPEERAEAIAIVTDELDRMSRMVDDLLLLARSERPDFLVLDLVSVEDLTDELFTKAASLAARAWSLEGVGKGTIVADRQRLTQAVMQLAQNAAEHTDPGQTIALGSVLSDGHARFWVRDAGPGVSTLDAERIFERFSRGSRTRRTEGAGLGLSIVRAIAEAHFGTVQLDSAAGRGAMFTIVVPVDPPVSSAGIRP